MIKKYLIKTLTISFLSCALLFYSTKSEAQPRWYLGSHAGPSMTNIMGDFPGNNFKFGYSGGATVGLALGDDHNFSIQADIMASLKGFNQKYKEISRFEEEASTAETVIQFDNQLDVGYLEMPLTANYSITLGGGIFPYSSRKGGVHIDFFAGPYVGYMYGAGASFNSKVTATVQFLDEEGNVTNESSSTAEVERGKFRVDGRNSYGLTAFEDDGVDSFKRLKVANKLTEGLKSIDIGVTGGLGISFDVGENGRLGIEGRYSRGMVSMDDDYFNSFEVIAINPVTGEPALDRSTADIKNVQMAAYLSYVYYLPNNTF